MAKLDWIGAALLCLGIVPLMIGLTWVSSRAFSFFMLKVLMQATTVYVSILWRILFSE